MFQFNQKPRNRSGVRGKKDKAQPEEENTVKSAEKEKKTFKTPSSGGKKPRKKKEAKTAIQEPPESPSDNSQDNMKKVFDSKYYEDPETRDSYRHC